jgi:hypothetical protein
VLEVVVAPADAGRSPEVVESGGVDPGLGEPLGELGIEGMKAADVRQDDDPRTAHCVGGDGERGEGTVSLPSPTPAPPEIGGNGGLAFPS